MIDVVMLAPAPRWWRLDAGRVLAQGMGLPAPADVPLLVAVPGEAVALHWLELPPLSPAQLPAAARMALGDGVAMPLDDCHIATAATPGGALVGVVSSTAMQGWLAELAAAGLHPHVLLPDPLLLPVPGDDGVLISEADGRLRVRGAALAMAGDAALVGAVLGDAQRQPVAAEDGLWQAATTPALNLRQGRFDLVQPWRPARARIRQLAALAAALLLAWVAGDVARWWQLSRAASRTEAALLAAATPLLPGRSPTPDSAAADVRARAVQLGLVGGASARLAPLLAALAQQPGLGLASLDYSEDTGLTAGLAGSAAARDAVIQALGPGAMAGGERQEAGQTVLDVKVAP